MLTDEMREYLDEAPEPKWFLCWLHDEMMGEFGLDSVQAGKIINQWIVEVL